MRSPRPRLLLALLLATTAAAQSGDRGSKAAKDTTPTKLTITPRTPSGAPLPNSRVSVSWSYRGGSSRRATYLGDGADLLLAAPPRADATLRLVFRDAANELIGTLEHGPAAWTDSDGALGEQRLTAPVVGLEGRVVTREGAPVAGVEVQLRSTSPHAGKSGADGSFQVLVPSWPLPEGALRVRSNDYVLDAAPGKSVPVDAGTRDLEVVVRGMGRVRVQSEGLPEGVIVTRSSMVPGRAIERRGDVVVPFAVDPTSDGFRLPEGRWDLVFGRDGEPGLRVDDVVVGAGVETHTAELLAFDWRPFLALVSVHVEDPRGRPTAAYLVEVRRAGTRWRHRARGSTTHLLVARDGWRCVVRADDHEPIELGQVEGDQFVRLGAGPLLVVELADAPELPAGVRLVARAGDVEAPLDANGRAALCLAAPRRATVRIAAVRGAARAELALELAPVEVGRGGAKVLVPDGAARRAALARALSSLR